MSKLYFYEGKELDLGQDLIGVPVHIAKVLRPVRDFSDRRRTQHLHTPNTPTCSTGAGYVVGQRKDLLVKTTANCRRDVQAKTRRRLDIGVSTEGDCTYAAIDIGRSNDSLPRGWTGRTDEQKVYIKEPIRLPVVMWTYQEPA
jgi:hypothetical protein